MTAEADQRILGAAERLFYARGIGPVSVQEIRQEADVSLKYLYSRFPSKNAIAEAYLRTRHDRWLADLKAYVGRHGGSVSEDVAAMFDWLHRWFTLPDFNGCAFANARNEVATLSPEASAIIDEHFAALRSYLRDITRPLPEATRIADELLVVLEGAIVLARSLTSSRPARTAKKVALQLVDEAERPTR